MLRWSDSPGSKPRSAVKEAGRINVGVRGGQYRWRGPGRPSRRRNHGKPGSWPGNPSEDKAKAGSRTIRVQNQTDLAGRQAGRQGHMGGRQQGEGHEETGENMLDMLGYKRSVEKSGKETSTHTSSCLDIACCVPLGSVLGPINCQETFQYWGKRIRDHKSLHILYCSLVLPYLQYCAGVWGNTTINTPQSLFILQKKSHKDNS